MKILYKFIERFIYNDNYLIFLSRSCLLFFGFNVILGFLLSILGLNGLGNNYSTDVIEGNPFFYFLVIVIFAPLIETVIFQWLPILLYKLVAYKESDSIKIFLILILSLFFGLVHSYDLLYQVRAFLSGVFLSTLTLFLADKKKNFFIPIFITHLFNNLILYIGKVFIV